MAHWEICDDCHGEGRHSKAIDGNGITGSEWAEWDDEDRGTYLSGGYDQTCGSCNGEGKVKILDDQDLVCPDCGGRLDDDSCECEPQKSIVGRHGQNPCAGCSRRYSDDSMACECCPN
jgi:hypothetical protein